MRLAEGILEDIRDGWHYDDSGDLQKDYAASVGNYLGRLKSEYKEWIYRLNETGGIHNQVSNLIAELY